MDTDEILELKCQFDILTRPDGSILLCEGKTTVLAGVYGPVECKGSKMLTDKALIEMNYRPKSGLPCVQDRFFATLRNTCEAAIAASSHPRSSIVITVQEMHNDGQLLSCAINAACLACLNSNIDMKFLFAATTCFLTKDSDLQIETPFNKENIQAIFVFTFESIKGNVVVSHTEGIFSVETYKLALEKCRDQSKQVFKFMKNQISERLINS